MATRKITKFWGVAPKISSELLPDQQLSFGQTAVNAKTYSGDLIPYRAPKVVASTGRSGEVKTIYPMVDPDTGDKRWLSWLNDVDVVVASSLNDEEQRIYYTGDGVPKVTNYSLAIGDGSGPFPADYYELGLPLPDAAPTTTLATLSDIAIANVSRDAENIATYTTSSAHGLRTGNFVSVEGFSTLAATGETTNATNSLVVTPVSGNVDFGVGSDVTLKILKDDASGAVSGTYTITAATSTTFTVVIDSISANKTGVVIAIPVNGFNIKSQPIVVVDDTSFTAYSFGPEMTATSGTFATDYGTDIVAKLSGEKVGRRYLYTWMTPWGEESIQSGATDIDYVLEGQTVTVGGLPTAAPAEPTKNFIRGFRVYRTITSTTGAEYFRLRTVWFPNTVASASRTSNVVTITMDSPHNLIVDDKIKITGVAFGGVADTSFDVTDVTVASVIDDYTFTYAATGADKVNTDATAGTLYYDIAQIDSGTSRYYESTTFVDDYDFALLSIPLTTQDADAPDPDMQGLTIGPKNLLFGFVGNELCVSEPGRPWSWPIVNRIVFDSPIVALANTSGRMLVLTERQPYYVDGDSPANLSYQRGNEVMPCLSKRGVVNLGYGVIFPTYGGLGVYGPQTGQAILTKLVHDWDTWTKTYDPTTVVAGYYNQKYFASHSTGSFIFEADEKVGGSFTTTPIKFYASYHDPITNNFYYISDLFGSISQWDSIDQPFMSLEWKSKTFIDNAYTSIGAARIVADFDDVTDEALAISAYNNAVPSTNTALWAQISQTGTINGPVDYIDTATSATVTVYGTLNSFTLNGDSVLQSLLSTAGLGIVTFRLWANKQLMHTVDISSSDIFRLPAGYKTDTFEVAVSGSVRIRAIHLSETPTGLGNT